MPVKIFSGSELCVFHFLPCLSLLTYLPILSSFFFFILNHCGKCCYEHAIAAEQQILFYCHTKLGSFIALKACICWNKPLQLLSCGQ
jgi:hypothetical protein